MGGRGEAGRVGKGGTAWGEEGVAGAEGEEERTAVAAAVVVVAAAAAEVEAPARETVRDQTGKERLPTARLQPPQIFSSPPWNP